MQYPPFVCLSSTVDQKKVGLHATLCKRSKCSFSNLPSKGCRRKREASDKLVNLVLKVLKAQTSCRSVEWLSNIYHLLAVSGCSRTLHDANWLQRQNQIYDSADKRTQMFYTGGKYIQTAKHNWKRFTSRTKTIEHKSPGRWVGSREEIGELTGVDEVDVTGICQICCNKRHNVLNML